MSIQKNVIIAGGTGLIGDNLIKKLLDLKFQIFILTRNPAKYKQQSNINYIMWNPIRGEMNMEELPPAEIIINLAGTPIVDRRWTNERKKLIIDSRVQSAQMLHQFILEKKYQPKLYIGASAIGIYGHSGENLVTESDIGNQDRFIVQSVLEWEKAHDQIRQLGVRCFIPRIGLVLSSKGGILEKMILPARFRLYPYFGDGLHWQSWVHIDDLTDIFLESFSNPKWEGQYNAVAPLPVRAKELTQAIKRIKGSGIMLSVPKGLLKLVMGEMHRILFDSNKISSEKIENAGFKFQYTTINDALKALL